LTKASEHKQTTDIVKQIVRLVIETNTLSMIVAVLSLILFYGTPNTTYFICPTMVLAKLCSTSLRLASDVDYLIKVFQHSSRYPEQPRIRRKVDDLRLVCIRLSIKPEDFAIFRWAGIG
jgi:hypothetical protein